MIVSAAFITGGLSKGENPKVVIIETVLKAPLEESLKLFGDYDIVLAKLKKAKIELSDAKSIDAIAKANKMSPFQLIGIINSK